MKRKKSTGWLAVTLICVLLYFIVGEAYTGTAEAERRYGTESVGAPVRRSESETEKKKDEASEQKVLSEAEDSSERQAGAEQESGSSSGLQSKTEVETESSSERQPETGGEPESSSERQPETEGESEGSSERQPETEGESEGSSERQEPETEGESEGSSEQEPETEGESESSSERQPETEGESEGSSERQEPETEGESEGSSEQQPETEGESEGSSERQSETEGESEGSSERQPETEGESEGSSERQSETEGESEGSSERQPESETESESEQAPFFEYWEDMTVRKAGSSARMRAVHPTIRRDNNFTMSYLGFYCYFKYTNDIDDKTTAVYCVYNTLEAPNNAPYQPDGSGAFSKEITYCLYNGCRYRGSTSYNPVYSTGNWRRDYYLTQIAIHVINHRQGRESSIESKLDKSKDPEVYRLAYKMVKDAFADDSLVSAADNQCMEVTCEVSPVSQKDWIKQKDGTWRTKEEYVLKSNDPAQITSVKRVLGEDAPEGVAIAVRDASDLLSPFWFTATEAAYRRIVRERLTVRAELQIRCTEYGGWWYVPVKSSLKRQYVTFLTKEETVLQRMQTKQVTASSDELEFQITLKKKDASDGAGLAGAVYGLYRDASATSLVTKFPATNEAGETALSNLLLEQDTYYVKELQPPPGYLCDGQVYSVPVPQSLEAHLELSDRERKVSLRIYKEGECLTGAEETETGVVFCYQTAGLAGAKFELYAADTVKNARGQVMLRKDELAAGNLVTGADGYAQTGALFPGQYYLVEKSAPQFMVSAGARIPVSLLATQQQEVSVNTVTVRNQRQQLELQVLKKDRETGNGLFGATFGIYTEEAIHSAAGVQLVKAGTLLGTAVSDDQGRAVFRQELPGGGRYVVRELQAPAGYVRDTDWKYSFSFADHPEMAVQKLETVCAEERCRGTLQIQKVDIGTGTSKPQGDASLEGAKYGLFARETIVHPDGHTGVLYEKGAQAALLTTDSNGQAAVGNLYPGSYVLKELEAPAGYVKDEKEHMLTVSPDSEGEQAELYYELTLGEQVKQQPFQLLKVSGLGETNPKPLEGAGFTAWLLSDLKEKEQGGYETAGVEPAVIGADGEKELFTDERGYLCTAPLPYGTYLVRETTVPKDHKPVQDFTVVISEHHPDEPQPWKVFVDDAFTARLKVVKKDQESGATVLIPGAEFRIWDYAKETYVEQRTVYPQSGTHTSFFTDETGSLTLPESLAPGRYRIEEVAAPAGYLKNEETVDFTVSSDMAYRVDSLTGEPLIQYEVYDRPVYGAIRIRKQAEQLEHFEETFVYGEHALADVTFAVYAEEDIVTPDGQLSTGGAAGGTNEGSQGAADGTDEGSQGAAGGTDEGSQGAAGGTDEGSQGAAGGTDEGSQGAAGESARKMASAAAETGVSEPDRDVKRQILYQKGTLVTTVVTDAAGCATTEPLPLGTYRVIEQNTPSGLIPEPEGWVVTLLENGTEQEVVTEELILTNIRRSVDLQVHKVDKVTKRPLAGGKFTLYAKEEICSFDGTVLVQADEAVASCVTDENGAGSFSQDLPPGLYYVKEEQAPDGYVNEYAVQEADLRAEQAEGKAPVSVVLTFENIQTEVEISKTDITDGQEIPGARLTILREDGSTVAAWVSEKTPHRLSGLKPGRYILREEMAPFGYIAAEDVSFVVENTGEVQKVKMEDRHAMGRLKIEKRDSEGTPLAGAVFELRTEAGELLETLISDERGIAKSVLYEIGTFANGRMEQQCVMLLTETKAPEGYLADDTVHRISFAYQGDRTDVIEVVHQAENQKQSEETETEMKETETEEKKGKRPGHPEAPGTGDTTPWSWMTLLLGASAAALGMLGLKSRGKSSLFFKKKK